jgi:long-subunit acyl-CoA synthetase (AMP-forming)
MDLENPWRPLCYRYLRQKASPVLVFEEEVTTPATIWAGARLWSQALKGSESPVVLSALRPGPEFLEALAVTLQQGGTWIGGHGDLDSEAFHNEHTRFQPDLIFQHRSSVAPPGYSKIGEANMAMDLVCYRRDSQATESQLRGMSVGSRRFLLSTSGTGGARKWVALSDRSVFSVLRSHIPRMNIRGANVLSVLPWNHAFGFILDLLPALFSARMIVRSGRLSTELLLELRERFGVDYMSAVPALLQRLLADVRHEPQVLAILREFRGGIVGGAPLDSVSAEKLRGTAFRIGYGQTEASPGITLGEPGAIEAGWLGSPLGCDTRIADGQLWFRGPNVCSAVFDGDTVRHRNPEEWFNTQDMVRAEGNGYLYLGRSDQNFKLSNGRFFDAVHWEDRLSRLSGVQSAFILPRNGMFAVYVVLSPEPHGTAEPVAGAQEARVLQDVQKELGSLNQYLAVAETVDYRSLPRTKKGAVNREALSKAVNHV